ncbi:MAG: phosphatase PAP2 family protein [Negativicutes bacterium]|nr:phosphatase PAP2 family protein [Negativicutes bacterium]
MQQNTRWAWLSLLACFIGFAAVAVWVAGGKTAAFDGAISGWIQSFQSGRLAAFSLFMAAIGQPRAVLLAAIAIAVLGIGCAAAFKSAWLKTAVVNLSLFVAVNLSAYLSEPVLKELFQRPRPISHISSYSFPSGHAMLAFAFCITGAYLLARHVPSRFGRNMVIAAATAVTVLMGLSRIYLNVHYPTDIIAGFFASGFLLSLIILLFDRGAALRKN